jgi:UDP-N-acetylmuramate-alanine ligase
MATFLGISRRLEQVSAHPIIIDDFAQSPPRVTASLQAVKQHFSTSQIKVFFEPNASFLQNKLSLSGYRQAFQDCSEVVVSQLSYKNTLSRVTIHDYQQEIGDKLKYIPVFDNILQHYVSTLSASDMLVHFSSGGLKGIQLLNQIKSHFTSK